MEELPKQTLPTAAAASKAVFSPWSKLHKRYPTRKLPLQQIISQNLRGWQNWTLELPIMASLTTVTMFW